MPHANIGQHTETVAPNATANPALAQENRRSDPRSHCARSLCDYFAQQHQMLKGTELASLLEPRRIQAPPGYHSTRCVSAGLFALLGNRALKAAAGLPHIPTEIAAHVVAYQVIRYRVPIYFIEEEFVRAMAAAWQEQRQGR